MNAVKNIFIVSSCIMALSFLLVPKTGEGISAFDPLLAVSLPIAVISGIVYLVMFLTNENDEDEDED